MEGRQKAWLARARIQALGSVDGMERSSLFLVITVMCVDFLC
jgi:hypothetical protein